MKNSSLEVMETTRPIIGPDAEEGLIEFDGQDFYCIPDVGRIPPFLMSIISDGDRWMFLSSSGGLTAGRQTSEHALFPYETDDRLHEAGRRVGPITSVRVDGIDGIWKPFHHEAGADGGRRLAKATTGDAVLFEEDHPTIPLTFNYRWSSCERYGFVRRSRLTNRSEEEIRLSVVDGVINVLPSGVDPGLDMGLRNLTNAYKRSELVSKENRLAVYSMESRVSDRPEPSEMLRANVVWSFCPENFDVGLNRTRLNEFEDSLDSVPQQIVTGKPGAYLVSSELCIPAGSTVEWFLVCDVAKSQADVIALQQILESGDIQPSDLDASLTEAREHVKALMASADAVQLTGDRVASAYHYSNVLNNSMRGGVPVDGYNVDPSDFAGFVQSRNVNVYDTHSLFLLGLPEVISHAELMDRIRATGDAQFRRIGFEYLPFSFSRRHGDPSRPWNHFSIQVHDDEGRATSAYEGNWRDIFQNWEALCESFPGFLSSVISVFVNASTVDGFNPYRISRAGIDWEVPQDDDPWANLGYWGDHQIAYLLALLESSERHQPGQVSQLLPEQLFSYADVPYRLTDLNSLLNDPKNTISFDREADERAQRRAREIGGDGRLLWSGDKVHLVSLAEKLVVPALSKLSNFVPGGGIWMNTQRPEWNDANNALVGNGLSMVTLLYLRRYLHHLRSLVAEESEFLMSSEVATWIASIKSTFAEEVVQPTSDQDAEHRFCLMARLGSAFSDYRAKVVGSGFTGTRTVTGEQLIELVESACEHLDATIAAARRPDGMFHSYNILHLNASGESATVEHLSEMLEGQVAALSSGVLSHAEAVELIECMLDSSLYRPDIESFLLYPAVPPKSFLAKNVISEELCATNPLLVRCLEVGDTSLVLRDVSGVCRFAPELGDRSALLNALDNCEGQSALASLAVHYRAETVALYEEVFGHHSYTGRSSSMYAFEGIGSVYWHMVAKLLVGIQQTMGRVTEGVDVAAGYESLEGLYRKIRSGTGPKKSAQSWGAIPTDPYSHSPLHAGAQQPGMTGFAKEEVLVRPLELGLRVTDGDIHFAGSLVSSSEFLTDSTVVSFQHVSGEFEDIVLPAQSLLLSCCQVPVVVKVGSSRGTTVVLNDGSEVSTGDHSVGAALSSEVFSRSGRVKRVEFTTVL